MQDYLVKIGLVIRKARKARGLSIENMALDTHLTPATVSNLENANSKDLKLSTVFKVIDYLDIDLYWFLSWIMKDGDLSKNKRELVERILETKDSEIDKLNLLKNLIEALNKD